MDNTNTPEIAITPRDAVMGFIKALNIEDFTKARQFTDEKMKFVGVMGSRNGAEAYFKDMRNMKFKYKVRKAFADGNDVCLLYDIDMNGTTIFCCGWYQVKDGKIVSLQVVFDPRPLLQDQ